jgi:hypothetical protein
LTFGLGINSDKEAYGLPEQVALEDAVANLNSINESTD